MIKKILFGLSIGIVLTGMIVVASEKQDDTTLPQDTATIETIANSQPVEASEANDGQ